MSQLRIKYGNHLSAEESPLAVSQPCEDRIMRKALFSNYNAIYTQFWYIVTTPHIIYEV